MSSTYRFRTLWRASRVARAVSRQLSSALYAMTLIAVASRAPGAQTPAKRDSASLRLGTLFQLVAQRSPRLDAARALARAAQARVSGARRPPDPQLQLGFMNRALPSLAPMDPLGMTQLQLMQMLPVAGKLGLAGDVAEAQASASRERAEDVRWELRSRVAMAFYDLYQADRSIDVVTNTRRLLQDISTTAQTMYAVGDGRQADVLKAQVEIARMTEELVRMEAMRRVMTSRISGLIDREIDSTLGSPELPVFPVMLPPLDSLQRMAELNRPMIRAGMEDVRAADASLGLARREIWPDLQLGVQLGRQGTTMGQPWMGSLMIGASLPVFARSRQYRMREEAEAMKAMASADVTAMRSETRARVAELYADLERARNLTTLYRSTILPQAAAAVASSLAAYRVGQVNLMTLLDNQMTVNRYQQDLFTLEAEQGKAFAEIEMLIGRELIDANMPDTKSALAPATRSGQ